MLRFGPTRLAPLLLASLLALACSDDDTVEADRLGLGGGCSVDEHCAARAGEAGDAYEITCISGFDGGYCGIDLCDSGDDCPGGSACVFHDNGQNYCFRLCDEDAECNQHRNDEVAATCSSNARFAGGEDLTGASACIPPAG